jgi:FAD/FMN-containing dehydrogenase
MLGPGLGGGHGRYQGFYGLISDNIRKLNVVLANGTAIEVSNTSHPDLYWGMQGAGHNFGAVTSFELNIYPRLVDTWYFKNYVFTIDKLEELFEALNVNDGEGSQPAELMNIGFYYMDANFSTTEASKKPEM